MGYTLVPGNPAKESVSYPALVAQVELLTGGELMHSCSRRLADRGWGLLININESIRFLHDIRVESSMVQDGVESHWNPGKADCFNSASRPSWRLDSGPSPSASGC